MTRPNPSIIALTGRQKLAPSLGNEGHTHEKIAELMGIRHRSAATRLIARARKARRALLDAMQELIGSPG